MTEGQKRHIGVTVMPEYIQSDGVDAVLDRLARMGATSVTTSPYVARLADETTGYREPPFDAGKGGRRLLDRPLWGRHELFIGTAPSFAPNEALYRDTAYEPERATELTRHEGPVIAEFLAAAKARGMTTCLQIMAAIPPCLRVQFGQPRAVDQPMMPGGRPVPARIDRNASLAATELRLYLRGLIRDLAENYPDCDVLRFDWPEYPPYHFLSLFADYNPQVRPFAEEIGIDLARTEAGMIDLIASLPDAPALRAPAASPAEKLAQLCDSYPVLGDHMRLRAHLVASHAAFLRDCIDEASGGRIKLMLQGFPPPWNILSGFDPARLRGTADLLAIKFYTMHWPVMGENYVNYAAKMLKLSPDLLSELFQVHFMGRTKVQPQMAYPDPDEAHAIPAPAFAQKIGGFDDPDVIGIAHSYGPAGDVLDRFTALYEATRGRIEINRYAYLSDEKIDAIAAFVAAQRNGA